MNVRKELDQVLSNKNLDPKTIKTSDLTEIIGSSDSFKEPNVVLEILQYLISKNQDEREKCSIKNIRCMCLFGIDEHLIGEVFKREQSGEITRDQLIDQVKVFLKSEDPIFVLLAATCGILTEIDNFEEYEDLLRENIRKLENLLKDIGEDFSLSYENYCNVLDTIFYLNNLFSSKYDKNLIIEEHWINEILDKLHAFEDSCINEAGVDPYPVKDVKPEDLGYLDITKVEKEE